MTIQNWDAFKASIWDWAPLGRCFPRGILPMDIDGWTEVGGVFLVLEGKAPGVPLKPGTVNTFRRMSNWNKTVPNLFTIVVLWGDAKAGRIERLQFWPNPPFDGGWPQLIAYVEAWAENAEERAAIQAEGNRQTVNAPIVKQLSVVPRVHASVERDLTDKDISW